MAMNLQCPECGHKFEIEESQQAQDNQVKALEAQEKELVKAQEEKLAELNAAHEKEKISDINAEVEKQLKVKEVTWKKNASQEALELANKKADKEKQK